jgi:hypothetical protein
VHAPVAHALTAGFQRALFVGSIILASSVLVALRGTNARAHADAPPTIEAEQEVPLAA